MFVESTVWSLSICLSPGGSADPSPLQADLCCPSLRSSPDGLCRWLLKQLRHVMNGVACGMQWWSSLRSCFHCLGFCEPNVLRVGVKMRGWKKWTAGCVRLSAVYIGSPRNAGWMPLSGFCHPLITCPRALRENQHTLFLFALQSIPMLTQVGTLVGA